MYNRGMGAVIAADGSISYPWYCSFPVLGVVMDLDCAPATPDQIIAQQKSQFGPALTPEMQQRALAAGAVTAAAYAKDHPDEAAAYTAAWQDPTASALLGTDFVNIANNVNPSSGNPLLPPLPGGLNWTYVFLAVGALAAIVMIGGRR